MAQDTTPSIIIYTGDGSQTRFEVPFDKGAYGEIKVAFVRRGLTDYTYDPDTYDVKGYLYAWNGGVYTKAEEADTTTPLYDKDGVATGDNWSEGMYREPKNDIFTKAEVWWEGDTLTTDDIICIVRDTTSDQPYSYPNNQKHIERALDNLSRQIQEVAKKAQNALLVDPAWMSVADGGVADENKLDPVTWLQTIVRSKGQTLRELRIENDYIMYSSDDPDSAEKTWEVIAGVKTGNAGVVSHIRETKFLADDGVTYITHLEYSVDGGSTWKPAGRAAAELSSLFVKKSGDTMSGSLGFQKNSNSPKISIWQVDNTAKLRFGATGSGYYGQVILDLGYSANATISPSMTGTGYLGLANAKWGYGYINTLYTSHINNGYDIKVPVTNSADTLALKSQVDDAANSGSQLYRTGVWYAKMETATTIPSSAEVEGRNYADFSQVDQDNNPIIVVYTYTSGVWVLTETITPPANYNGYMTITSKIWDIQEQAGQQGGLVLWSYNQKTFTPYPRIISTDSINITNSSFSNGTITGSTISNSSASLSSGSTVTMGQVVSTTDITNVGYVTNYQSRQDITDVVVDGAAVTVELTKDSTIYFVEPTTDTTITIDSSAVAEVGVAKTFEIHVVCGATLHAITWVGIDSWLTGSLTTPTDTNTTNIFVVRVQQRPSDVSPIVIANYGGVY